jgi:DNA-binding transcriptional MocR family regulator
MTAVLTDNNGLIPEALDSVLTNWETEKAKYKNTAKPRVLYTVPTGQNPSGSTLSLERRKQV